jgi:hypothetical protein
MAPAINRMSRSLTSAQATAIQFFFCRSISPPTGMPKPGRRNCGRLLLTWLCQEEIAASRTSIQCFTGAAVPLCKCVMQPMLAEMIARGASSPK